MPTYFKRTCPRFVAVLGCLLLSGCPFLGANYVPDGYWRGSMTEAEGTITIAVQDGFVRSIGISGLRLESPDDPNGVSTAYLIYINYGFIDGLFPGIEGLPILPTGTFIDHAITEDGSESIVGQIDMDLSASGTVTIVLFANNEADEVYEFSWTAAYTGEANE